MENIQLLTETEAARALKVSRMTLWRLRRAGALQFLRIGGRVRYPQQTIRDYVRRQICAARGIPVSSSVESGASIEFVI